MGQVTSAQWDLTAGSAAPAGLLEGIGASLRQVRVRAGHVATRHSHPFEQFVIVVAGGGELDCEDGSIVMQPGCVIRLAPDAWHSAAFHSDTILIEANLATPAQ